MPSWDCSIAAASPCSRSTRPIASPSGATTSAPNTSNSIVCTSAGRRCRARQFVSSFDRPNIRYRIVEKAQPRRQLLEFLRAEHPNDAGIVYCLSRKKVEETAAFLQEQGFPALPYHAGLPQEQRRAHQAEFLRGEGVIICATIAFGMGIDKPDVRFVAHLDLPKSVEAYYQETGRAGRDGLPADAWLCYGLGDVVTLRRIIGESLAEERFKRVELHKLDALVGLCETIECRRRVLLGYFGEARADACGNCDTCLTPVETWDGSVAAQKAMSCIYRTGQRFGASYLADVLLGKDNARIRRFGHDRVSTYGIGKDLSAEQWRSVYRQLVAAGLVEVDVTGHGSLRLTERSRPVLRGEQSVRLRRDPDRRRRHDEQRRAPAVAPTDPEAAELWDRLRACRRVLAEQQNVPPFAIFHDTTLREMVSYRPRHAEELTCLTGVGAVKLERYGAEFLDVLAAHEAEHGRPDKLPPLPAKPLRSSERLERARDAGLSPTARETLDLFRAGVSIEEIAARRDIKPTTVYSHLARCIEEDELKLADVTNLSNDEIRTIQYAFERLADDDSPMTLKPVYDALQGRYDYGLLRCVRAGIAGG